MTGEPTAQAVITGVGLAIEDPARADFARVIDEARTHGGAPWVTGDSDPALGLPSAKDRKILSADDVLAARAATAAVAEAFPHGIAGASRTGAIAFGCGKATRAIERRAPYSGFRTADRFDSIAFAGAVARAAIQIDPLRLLHGLNNNVVWWLAKQYQLGGVNLQITQLDSPDLWSLISAVDLIERGACDAVVVAGVQTIDQSAIQLTAQTGALCREDSPAAGGAAIGFVLERNTGQRHAAALRLRLDTIHVPAPAAGVPALAGALAIYRACLEARARDGVALIELGRPA